MVYFNTMKYRYAASEGMLPGGMSFRVHDGVPEFCFDSRYFRTGKFCDAVRAVFSSAYYGIGFGGTLDDPVNVVYSGMLSWKSPVYSYYMDDSSGGCIALDFMKGDPNVGEDMNPYDLISALDPKMNIVGELLNLVCEYILYTEDKMGEIERRREKRSGRPSEFHTLLE